MLMVAVHFVTFPMGGHTAAPQRPFRFISQTYSVLQPFSKFIQPLDPSYKHFRPGFVLLVPFIVPTLERETISHLFEFFLNAKLWILRSRIITLVRSEVFTADFFIFLGMYCLHHQGSSNIS
jgi:hypothetical protein